MGRRILKQAGRDGFKLATNIQNLIEEYVAKQAPGGSDINKIEGDIQSMLNALKHNFSDAYIQLLLETAK